MRKKNYIKKKERLIKGSKICYNSTITETKEIYEYLLFKTDVKNKEFIKLINKPKISIAFKKGIVKNQKEVVKADSSNLFVFFETNYDTQLNFLLQAPLSTTPLKMIDFTLKVNAELLDELCDLMKNVLDYFKSNKLITIDFLNQLPIDYNVDENKIVYYKFFNVVKSEFKSSKKYLPTIVKD